MAYIGDKLEIIYYQTGEIEIFSPDKPYKCLAYFKDIQDFVGMIKSNPKLVKELGNLLSEPSDCMDELLEQLEF